MKFFLKHIVAGKRRFRSGQVMIEYAAVVGMLLAAMAILTLLLTTFNEYGERVLRLAGSEYP